MTIDFKPSISVVRTDNGGVLLSWSYTERIPMDKDAFTQPFLRAITSEIRAGRAARRARRQLRQLSEYTSEADRHELEAILSRNDTAETEQIRSLMTSSNGV